MREKRLEIAVLVLLVLLWRAAFFTVSVQQLNLSGDEAIRSLQAMSITQPKDSYHVQLQQEPRGLFGHYPLLFMAQPYLFPVEAYFSAPFIRWLPRSAFGSRLIPACMGLITCWLGLLLVNRAFRTARREGEEERIGKFSRYGALLLVVFPSTFLLVLQVAYPLPSYQAFMMLGLLALWLAERNRTVSWKNPLFALGSGFSVALAASNSLLALPLVAGVGVMVGVGCNWRKALTGTLSCALGIAAGLFPYFLAKVMYPGAHAAVSTLVTWDVALRRLWEPAVTFTLPVVLGMRSPLIPGWEELIGVIPIKSFPYVGYLWTLFIFCALGCCIYFFILRLIRNRWPEVTVWDVMTGLSVGYLLIFVLSTRFGAREFRYLMPVALFFPLILAWLLSISKGFLRYILMGMAWVFVAINIITSVSLMKAWLEEDFDGGFADTRPAVEWLKQHGIEHCYSSYMDVYTINYFAKEQVVCSQPYNQRFPGWPYPYGKAVDNASDVAFVLGPSKRFSRARLEHELRESGVSYQEVSAGTCQIYYDFDNPGIASGDRIEPKSIKVIVSHHQEDSNTLSDGILTHKWRTHVAQSKGMWIELTLPQSVLVRQLKIYYNGYPHDHARSLDIIARKADGTWQTVRSGLAWRLQPFDFINNHPVYSNLVQRVDMQGVQTNAIRIEIAEPNPGRDWTIGEIEVQLL